MGMQDRDWYRDETKRKRESEHTGTFGPVPKFRLNGSFPRWFVFIVSCLAAYGFVAFFRDAGRLLKDLTV